MFHVKYKLKTSDLHGIGVFADEDIAKGTLIYTSSPLLDVNITNEEFETLSENEKQEIKYWGFWIESTQRWHVDFDVSRFINHSFEGTVTQDPTIEDAYLTATKDINAGEELCQNYLEFETIKELKARGIKIPENIK
ncbi:MAG TPA: SET domain-containing protein [Alphaproteobacteria bacterium]|nr:SET domain-containing protein [Alphaproteobacteria bacterium]HOO52251.1 SET domain-containing protein [Alphaproteobacteria bacterium]